MKIVSFVLGGSLLLAVSAPAQQVPLTRVPVAARDAFASYFATATAARWEKERGSYEVSFTQGGRQMSALLSAAGELKETETELPVAQLPAAVQAALARDYKATRVGEAARIRRADGSTVYEAEISWRGHKQDVLFTAAGHVTK